jgi:hypothetical protein
MDRSLHLTRCALAALACACGAPQVRPAAPGPVAPAPAPAARPAAGLELVVLPREAEIEIEGVRRAPASALARESGGVVPLPPGVYRVSIRHPGYETWRGEVAVASGVERIEVTLAEQR